MVSATPSALPAELPVLLPQPRQVISSGEVLRLDAAWGPLRVEARGVELPWPLLELLPAMFAALGLPARLLVGAPSAAAAEAAFPEAPALHAIVAPGLLPRPEHYQLTVAPQGITLLAATAAGLQHGLMTLRQLLRRAAPAGEGAWTLPCLRIEDWPDFAQRGVMLDISRDKVPTMETLRGLVELFAELKYNQLQLYTEHTFAYARHEDVWREASPLTPAEILELDALCRARQIELVPNQNSFGHMERWLKLPRFNHLAETPGTLPLPLDKSFSICPLDPGSLELLAELYDELLPHFSSTQFNVGCDETFELGEGRSREACATHGKGRVYLEFLLKIHALVSRRGHTMQFWGDIIMQHPELIAELPAGLIALEWGYEAAHPFAEDTRLFAAAGVPFYVCPGTSSWNALGGRTTNMLGNLTSAAEHGAAQGALGYLVTDWGDHGHLQPLPISYPGFAFGAAQAWCRQGNPAALLAEQLDLHVLHGAAPGLGQWLLDLGDAYRLLGAERPNQSLLCTALYFAPAEQCGASEMIAAAADGGVGRTLARLDELEAALPRLLDETQAPGNRLLRRELDNTLGLMRHGAHLLEARITQGEAGKLPVAALPVAVRGSLADELAARIEEHEAVWLGRNRRGGLADSAGRLRAILSLYRGTR